MADALILKDRTFQIIEKIGQGGMGQLYLVRETATGKLFALKKY